MFFHILVSVMNVAVVGASGAVGQEMILCLHSERLVVGNVWLFASERSAGRMVDTPFGRLEIEEFSIRLILERKCRIVLLAVSGSFSREWSPALVDIGCIVIDNSSAFRYNEDVPLVIPEMNFATAVTELQRCARGLIIANPNCTTAISAMVLHPLHVAFGSIKTMICSTYQAASGAGEAGMRELEDAIASRSRGDSNFNPTVFSHNLCCNVIPAIDTPEPNGYTKEEMKMVWETRKIFADPNMRISCTAVRVPTMRAHCIAVSLELGVPVTPDKVREVLQLAPGVRLVDDLDKHKYPLPSEAAGRDEVLVGRIRQSLVFGNSGIDLFIAGDQLRRGAALNAVRICSALLPHM